MAAPGGRGCRDVVPATGVAAARARRRLSRPGAQVAPTPASTSTPPMIMAPETCSRGKDTAPTTLTSGPRQSSRLTRLPDKRDTARFHSSMPTAVLPKARRRGPTGPRPEARRAGGVRPGRRTPRTAGCRPPWTRPWRAARRRQAPHGHRNQAARRWPAGATPPGGRRLVPGRRRAHRVSTAAPQRGVPVVAGSGRLHADHYHVMVLYISTIT
jgi:hypothetical protein